MDVTAKPQVNELQNYINQLVDLKFAEQEDITESEKVELRKDAFLRLFTLLQERTYQSFSDQDAAAFDKLIDEKKPLHELEEFTNAHIPDYETLVATIFQEFQQIYLND